MTVAAVGDHAVSYFRSGGHPKRLRQPADGLRAMVVVIVRKCESSGKHAGQSGSQRYPIHRRDLQERRVEGSATTDVYVLPASRVKRTAARRQTFHSSMDCADWDTALPTDAAAYL